MKKYKMLKTVRGARDGLKVETFHKDEVHAFDAHLAEQFYYQAAIEEVAADGDSAPNLREGAHGRSTKVTGPTETKEGEAGIDLNTQNIEELVALARDAYGLEVDSTMDEAALRELIRGAQGADDAKGEAAPTKKADAKPAKKK